MESVWSYEVKRRGICPGAQAAQRQEQVPSLVFPGISHCPSLYLTLPICKNRDIYVPC